MRMSRSSLHRFAPPLFSSKALNVNALSSGLMKVRLKPDSTRDKPEPAREKPEVARESQDPAREMPHVAGEMLDVASEMPHTKQATVEIAAATRCVRP
jgi:hypothetical protein